MEGLHPLVSTNGDDPAQAAVINEALHRRVERCVAQDEAERDSAAEFARTAVDFLTAVERFGGGFFQQQIVSQFERADRVVKMLRILSGDDQDVREFSSGEKRFFGIKLTDLTLCTERGHRLPADRMVIGGGRQLVAVLKGGDDP